MYWDGVGALIIAGIVLLVTSFVCGGMPSPRSER
jgi:ABC-type multidrug transport system permease subunit